MRIKRTGKCDACQEPCVEYKSFDEQVDMFNPEARNVITKDISELIKAWRDEPMHCQQHQKVRVA